ncbi:MAG: adenine deaminase C-terminal domain-containing protein [Streptosporangiaceae bacterium]
MPNDYWPDPPDRRYLAAVALGEHPADLVVQGGQLVDVFTGEIYPADVAVAGSRIAMVGDASACVGPATEVVEAKGRYLAPGFIDSHFHVGASALVPAQLATLMVPHGTAAIVTDFYEPGHMAGTPAIRLLLDEAARSPLKVYLSPFYVNMHAIDGIPGIRFDDFKDMLSWPECIELREWNAGVELADGAQTAPLASHARQLGIRLGGHLKALDGPALQASVALGAQSEHEAHTAQEALTRARLGVAIQARFSSGRRSDLPNILEAITRHHCDPRLFMFCTDEEDVDELADLGHIDHRVRWAIELGVAPIDALRMASLNAATHLGITGDLGSITPGRFAFINLLDDLSSCRVSTVVAGPRIVGQSSRYVAAAPEATNYPAAYTSTIHVQRPFTPADFAVTTNAEVAEAEVRVIGVDPAVPGTRECLLRLPVRAGVVCPEPGHDVAKIAVADRHTGNGQIGVGFLQGFGIEQGAFGFSFHPGPFNIGLLGMNDADIALVANRIAEIQGGFVAARDGQVLAEVPLPVFGYLSDAPADRVVSAFRQIRKVIGERLGCTLPGLYTAFGYLCLPDVAPRLRMTAKGLQLIELSGSMMTARLVPVLLE